MATKPELAIGQLRRLAAAGLPTGWVAFDEVYTRSGTLRETCGRQEVCSRTVWPRTGRLSNSPWFVSFPMAAC